MPKRSKLLQALDDHKGRDYDAEKQKKLVKAAEKKKKEKKGGVEDEDVKMGEEEKVWANTSFEKFSWFMHNC